MATEAATGTLLTIDREPEGGTESRWTIDPKHSMVEFAVRHMRFTTVRGRFKQVEGTIHCPDEADRSRAWVEAEIDAASIDTGDPDRDNHLRSAEFLDVERYPTITFRSKRVDPQDEDELWVVGDLTIRGETREVELATVYNGRGTNPWGQEVAGFTATTQINRKDFGLTWNVALEAGGFLVGDTLDVLVEVQADKES
jgi:polyisoprenoid-binding protein YceI